MSTKDTSPIRYNKGWAQRLIEKKYWIPKYGKNPFIIIPAIVLILLLGYYFIHFSNEKISYNNQDWVGFSSYFKMIFSFVNLILFATLAITTYEYSKTSDVQRRIDNRRFDMPIIGFSRNKTQQFY